MYILEQPNHLMLLRKPGSGMICSGSRKVRKLETSVLLWSCVLQENYTALKSIRNGNPFIRCTDTSGSISLTSEANGIIH